MISGQFLPEGRLLYTAHNRRHTATQTDLAAAALSDTVLEGRVSMCDTQHNLHVDLPAMPAIIPYEEGAIGIAEGTTRDIALISRVGKAVSFVVTGFEHTPHGMRAVLSRKRAQQLARRYFEQAVRVGDIIPAKVTRLENFGAFCDIGCGIPALVPIAGMSVSRISHPADRLAVGMDIYGVVSSVDGERICLSCRELLGTWEENAALFSQGQTVVGVVRSVEAYGVFIELAPNLAGLAEPREGVKAGDTVSVYIKSILPDKMKVKLIIIDTDTAPKAVTPPRYFITEGHLDRWQYSPIGSAKCIESNFT